jgi:signal transduction histidine kinase
LYARDEREHRLVLQVPDEPIFVCGDVVRLEQVVVNLVSNAIKYSPRGGTIRVVVEKTATDAILSVSDEGVGIPERDVDVIFEPFHRAGPSRDLAPGAGLGLSILARIVRAHGGRVEVQSKVGRGSTFYVVLPLAASPEECSAGPSDPSR